MTGKEMADKRECKDKNCPIHGQLKTSGRKFRGRIVSTRMEKTVTVKMVRVHEDLKYERFGKRTTRIKAHLSSCTKVNEGDIVQIEECRPLSKTKSFVVTKVV